MTLRDSDQGDTTTTMETVAEAGEWIAEAAMAVNDEGEGERVNAQDLQEVVVDTLGLPAFAHTYRTEIVAFPLLSAAPTRMTRGNAEPEGIFCGS